VWQGNTFQPRCAYSSAASSILFSWVLGICFVLPLSVNWFVSVDMGVFPPALPAHDRDGAALPCALYLLQVGVTPELLPGEK
jgi:hypothetical protein